MWGTCEVMSKQIELILHLADNALILGQRNAEWCGHGPVLEEDIAMANFSLDLIGQARLLYQHAAALDGGDKTEDHYAYWRGEAAFRNFTLCELPHHMGADARTPTERDYAVTIVRNAIWSAYMGLLWRKLAESDDAQLCAIAAKSAKEAAYHWRHARDWLVRLGDGTAESNARTQRALDYLWPYTAEFWTVEPDLHDPFVALMQEAADEATLRWPATPASEANAQRARPTMAARGAQGLHSEHMGYLLAEMQSVARAHPGAAW